MEREREERGIGRGEEHVCFFLNVFWKNVGVVWPCKPSASLARILRLSMPSRALFCFVGDVSATSD